MLNSLDMTLIFMHSIKHTHFENQPGELFYNLKLGINEIHFVSFNQNDGIFMP